MKAHTSQFVLILYIPVKNFKSCRNESSWAEPVLLVLAEYKVSCHTNLCKSADLPEPSLLTYAKYRCRLRPRPNFIPLCTAEDCRTEMNIWQTFDENPSRGKGDMEQTQNSRVNPLNCDLDLESGCAESWVLHIDILRWTFDQSLMKIFKSVQEIWSRQESVTEGHWWPWTVTLTWSLCSKSQVLHILSMRWTFDQVYQTSLKCSGDMERTRKCYGLTDGPTDRLNEGIECRGIKKQDLAKKQKLTLPVPASNSPYQKLSPFLQNRKYQNSLLWV